VRHRSIPIIAGREGVSIRIVILPGDALRSVFGRDEGFGAVLCVEER
jgi:hypothetical protein